MINSLNLNLVSIVPGIVSGSEATWAASLVDQFTDCNLISCGSQVLAPSDYIEWQLEYALVDPWGRTGAVKDLRLVYLRNRGPVNIVYFEDIVSSTFITYMGNIHPGQIWLWVFPEGRQAIQGSDLCVTAASGSAPSITLDWLILGRGA